MRVSLSAISGAAEAVEFEALPNSGEREKRPRITNTETLDGGNIITHSGFSEADVDIQVRARVSSAVVAQIDSLISNYTVIYASIQGLGIYKALIGKFTNLRGDISLTLVIKEKIS